MILQLQFLIALIFPLSFVGLLVYLRRSGLQRPQLTLYWTVVLISLTLWATTALRYYGGLTFGESIVFSWGVLGRYSFSLVGLGWLLTTSSYLAIPRRHRLLSVGSSVLLFGGAVALDPTLWSYQLPYLAVAGTPLQHFDLWAGVWIASWLVPVVSSWIVTQQARNKMTLSLYRNQVDYWSFGTILLLMGGLLASVQQPRQPGWIQAGSVLVIPGTLMATLSISRSQLPELQLILRQILSRLSGTLLIFGVTWGALYLISQIAANLPTGSSPFLVLMVGSAILAAFFTLTYRFVSNLTRRLFLPPSLRQRVVLADYIGDIDDLTVPHTMGRLFLRVIQANLFTDDAWLLIASDGPSGKLLLRPLSRLGNKTTKPADFSSSSPFTTYLRQNSKPLTQYDVDNLPVYDQLLPGEKSTLLRWQRVLFMPLHMNKRLVGVLALGPKSSGDAYDSDDYRLLTSLANQVAPLLIQSQTVLHLQRVNDFTFAQNQALLRERQHLQELTSFYTRFIELIGPDLRGPLAPIRDLLMKLQESITGKDGRSIKELGMRLDKFQGPLDALITMSGRVQSQTPFVFQLVSLNDVTDGAIRALQKMIEARRVVITFEPDQLLPAVIGDKKQLQEAAKHLLHNAIKFNKIGGTIEITCGVKGSEVYFQVVDGGVGISEDRLQTLWQGFANVADQKNGRYKQTGMGLVLTQYIINAHNGRLEAQSRYGHGSQFAFYLPVALEEAKSQRHNGVSATIMNIGQKKIQE